MKEKTKIITALVIAAGLILLFLAAGCVGPLYKTEGQFNQGKGRGLFGSEAAAQAESDRMALAKLKTTPVQTLVANGVPQGFRGCFYNNGYRDANIKIYGGPIPRGVYLTPHDKVYDYLLPGKYTAVLSDEYGNFRGSKDFHVSAQLQNFKGEEMHWYVVAPP